MDNKGLKIILGIMVIFVIIMGLRVLSSSPEESANDQISLTTNPDPVRMGPATFIITVKDTKGKPVKDATVSFDLNMTEMNMGTQQGTATSQGDGTYAATGRLSMQGPWRVSTQVKMPDGKVMNKDFTVNAQ